MRLKIEGSSLTFGKNSTLVRLVEPDYVNFLTSGPNNGVYSLSFASNNELVRSFE